MTYDLEDFLRSSAQVHESLFPDASKVRPVVTPCVVEDHQVALAATAHDARGACLAFSSAQDTTSVD